MIKRKLRKKGSEQRWLSPYGEQDFFTTPPQRAQLMRMLLSAFHTEKASGIKIINRGKSCIVEFTTFFYTLWKEHSSKAKDFFHPT